MIRFRPTLPSTCLLAALALAGCDDKPAANLAPTASALASAAPPAMGAAAFSVDAASSKVEFMMEAPQEKIRGRSSGTGEGTLNVDPTDLTKTRGLVAVDIGNLEVFQTVMDKDGKPGEEAKNDLQNKHARTWLEISEDAPEADRKKNGRVEFSIQKIDKVSDKDLGKMTGAERKVTLTATGDFLLHGHKATKTVDLEATFHFEGDKPTGVSFKTVKPFPVNLAEHDVKPREAFGKLAAKTLDILAPKVAKDAMVSVEFTAKPGGSKGGAAAPKAGEGDKPAEAMPEKDPKSGDKAPAPAEKPGDKPAGE